MSDPIPKVKYRILIKYKILFYYIYCILYDKLVFHEFVCIEHVYTFLLDIFGTHDFLSVKLRIYHHNVLSFVEVTLQ